MEETLADPVLDSLIHNDEGNGRTAAETEPHMHINDNEQFVSTRNVTNDEARDESIEAEMVAFNVNESTSHGDMNGNGSPTLQHRLLEVAAPIKASLEQFASVELQDNQNIGI
jgi:hypothetical protein